MVHSLDQIKYTGEGIEPDTEIKKKACDMINTCSDGGNGDVNVINIAFEAGVNPNHWSNKLGR